MHDSVHYVISSNRWFSAVTEYALQLCLFLKREGYIVQVLADHGSPILKHAERHGLYSRPLIIRARSFFEHVEGLFQLFRFLSELPSGQKSCLWVVEGPEHTRVAILRLIFRPIRRKTVLIRLRGQDRFRKPMPLLDDAVSRFTDFIVFPSYFALHKQVQLGILPHAKKLVQPFCKDFVYVDKISQKNHETALKHSSERSFEHSFFSTFQLDLNAAAGSVDGKRPVSWRGFEGRAVHFVTVARFDPVKGIRELIQDFFSADFSNKEFPQTDGGVARLFIIGRNETFSSVEVSRWALESAFLNAQEEPVSGVQMIDGLERYFVFDKTLKKQVFIFNERFEELSVFFRDCDFAVISSLGSEIICRTAVEYLQAGLPVLSTNVGSLSEVIGADAGIFGSSKGNCENDHCSMAGSFENAFQLFQLGRQYEEKKQAALTRGLEFRLQGYSHLVDQIH